MKVAFAGTPEFAKAALEALIAARFEVPLVLTQPDRPAGRGMRLQPSPVKHCALAHGVSVEQPLGLRLDGRAADDAGRARAALEAAGPDVMVVAAYGLILPAWVLTLPRLGCLNIHASLLPRWRGAAPIHRALEAGDADTGVTIMQMDEGLDTGPMLLREMLPIRPDDTTASLHDRLAALGARMIVEALELAACGGLRATPQSDEGTSYAHKIEKREAPLDWQRPAPELERRIRAFDPFPGAGFEFGGQPWKCWQAVVVEGMADARPGTVLRHDAEGPVVACGTATALRLQTVQRPGGRRAPAAPLLGVETLPVGAVLAPPAG